MKDKYVFDYEKLCMLITNISFISIIIFVSIQVLYFCLHSTSLLEVIFPVGTDKLFVSVIYCYGLFTLLYFLLFPFWIIFNIILEVVRIIKLVIRKEKIKFLNIIKISISLILYGIVCGSFFINLL